MKLPEAFEQRMRKQLGEAEFEAYLGCLTENVSAALRVNSLKLSPEQFQGISPFPLTPVPWIKKGFYYPDGESPAKHPYYYAGLYYLQEPSAMTPADLLPVKPGDRVLDLCAAPGGKTTELGAKLQGEGILVSNDISHSRAKALLKNVELFGIENALVLSETPEHLSERFSGFFDKILVDAPCSGEGMFRKQPAIMKNWEQYGTSYYNALQKPILNEAYNMLAEGGMLLYSTCTFSPEEDEKTVQWFLKNHPDIRLIDAIPEGQWERYESMGFVRGREDYLDDSCPDITKTVRLYPHRLKGEGHFVALFQKEKDTATAAGSVYDRFAYKKLPQDIKDFLSHIRKDFEQDFFTESEGRYYRIPKEMPSVKGLRVLRTGLLLGEVSKGRFTPSQALAMTLSEKLYDNYISLPVDDPRIRAYLKCESPDMPETEDGWALVLCDGYPLGFGKTKGGRFKNHYLPGWRMM
ncbi:MAG: RsmB/NOP family class I SAM-dependent RNA methyltransferase [Lachnospiraceae bacterium]|nr:RsmB/NOP family class I SAM-dependent RNA methyltransferase [Lachnospiraceae bacterium]